MQAQVEHLSVPSQTTRQERRYGVYMASRSTSRTSSPCSHSNTPSTLGGIISHRTSASEPPVDEDIIILDSTGIVIGPMPSLRPISIGIYRKAQGDIRRVELPPIITDLKGYKKASAPKLTVAGPMERGRPKGRELAGGAGGLLKVPDDHRHGRSGTRPRVLAMQKPRPFLEAPIAVPQKSLPPLQSPPTVRGSAYVGQANNDHDRPDLLCPPPAPKPPSLLLQIPVPVASSPTPKLFSQMQLTPIIQLLPSVIVSDSVEEHSTSPRPFLRLISLQLRSKVYETNSTTKPCRSDAFRPVLSQLITTDLTQYRLDAQAAAAQVSNEPSRQQMEKQKQTAPSRTSFFKRKATHHTPAHPSDSENEPRSRDSSHSSARSHSQDRQSTKRRGTSSYDHEGSPTRHTWLRRKARGVVSMVSGCIKDPEGKRAEGGQGAGTPAINVVLPVVAVGAPSDTGSGSDVENLEGRNNTTRKKRNRDIVKEHVRKLFAHHADAMDFTDSRLEEHWVYVERCLEQPNTSAVDMLAATGLPFGASPARSARVQEVPTTINTVASNDSTDSGPDTTFPVTGWSPSIERRLHSIRIVDPEVSPFDGDAGESEWHLVLNQNALTNEVDVGCYRDLAGYGAEKQCGICLEDYRSDDAILRLASCSHWLHQDCLEQWFESSRTCPVCRQEIGCQSKERSTRTASSVRPIFSVSPSIRGSSIN